MKIIRSESASLAVVHHSNEAPMRVAFASISKLPFHFSTVACGYDTIGINSPLGLIAMTGQRPSFSVLRVNPRHPKLIESYCPACGLLIAASPHPEVLRLLERIHACPVHFQYPKRA